MSDNTSKRMAAVSRAEYRNVSILETGAGCTVVLQGKTFTCKDLNEATALIDAAYAQVLMDPRTQAALHAAKQRTPRA